MAKVESDTIAAVREGRPIRDPKLEALRQFAAKITRQRGVVSEADVSAFKSTGHDNARCSIKRFRLALSLRAWAYFVARRGAAVGAMQALFGLGAFLGQFFGTRLESWTNS